MLKPPLRGGEENSPSRVLCFRQVKHTEILDLSGHKPQRRSRYIEYSVPTSRSPSRVISISHQGLPCYGAIQSVIFHRCPVPSPLPLASMVPSGLNVILSTQPVCLVSVVFCSPITVSHVGTDPKFTSAISLPRGGLG